MIFSFNFLIFLAVCLNLSIVINIKILTNSNQQTQSYKFTSHIAGFDHRDAWNLHTNIIWLKRSTDFKELSPCSVWYPLKECLVVFEDYHKNENLHYILTSNILIIRDSCFMDNAITCMLFRPYLLYSHLLVEIKIKIWRYQKGNQKP